MTDERGVYVTLQDLIQLQYRARGFNFLPRQPVHSLLTGRNASRMRGRGLNFEEIRGYLPGDDVRAIDWKVTARTREPHVRVYTEERDRPGLLVVDQRISMFFGSQRAMKSVVAAELAAAGAWRVFDAGDRVGAIVFDDRDRVEVRSHRSRATVTRILNAVVEKNRALRAGTEVRSDPSMLNRVLAGVAAYAKHDYLVAIVSDFDGADDATRDLVTRLAHHNDVISLPVLDPLLTNYPERGRLVVSNDELQVELDVEHGSTRKRLLDFGEARLASLLSWQSELGVPVLPIWTDRDPLDQVRHLLGVA